MPEQTTAVQDGQSWSGWVGQSAPVIQDSNKKFTRTISVATVVLLWLSSVVLIVSGCRSTFSGDKGVPAWLLVGLSALALMVVGLVLASGLSRRLAGLAVVFGLALGMPWILAGLGQEDVASNGSVVFTVALVVVALISGSAATPPHWLRLSVLLILVSVVWLSLAFAIMDLFGANFGALYLANERDFLGVAQVRGLLGHPNAMALLASLAAVLSLQFTRAAARSGRTRVAAPAALLGPVAATIVVLFTQSRIGITTLAVGLILVLLPLRGSAGRVWSYLLIFGVYAASILPPILAMTTPLTFHGRVTAWQVAIVRFAENPLLGSGPDAFQDLPQRFTTSWSPGHAHSTWLQAVSNAGWVGLAVLVLAAVAAASIAVRARPVDQAWGFGVIGVLAAYSWLEPALGVVAVPVTFLPVVLAAAVIGSAYTLAHSRPKAVPERGAPPRSPQGCEV